MKNLMFFLVSIAVIGFTSCFKDGFGCKKGEGSIETRTIELNEFEKVDLSIGANITFTEGETQKVEIRSYPNIIDAIVDKSSVSNNEWDIELPNGCYTIQDEDIEIFITIPTLKAVNVSGSGNVTTDGVFSNITDLALSTSGSCTYDMDFDQFDNLDLSSSGDVSFQLSGTVNSVNMDCSGSSQVDNLDLAALRYDITISGSSDCQIQVEENLDISISGSAKVCYQGNPSVTSHISGSGDVNECE